MWGWAFALAVTLAWFVFAALVGLPNIPAIVVGVCICAGAVLAVTAWERGRS